MIRATTVVLLILLAAVARAEVPNDIYTVDGKNFETKSAAVRYIISTGKRKQVLHTRCEILTNKLSFKACPKNKNGSWENEQFEGLKVQQ